MCIWERFDEGAWCPYQYEVEDFKQGYFVATVDRDFYSTFKVISYNKNGSTISEELEILPVDPTFEDQIIGYDGNEIIISYDAPNMQRMKSRRQLQSYSINSVNRISAPIYQEIPITDNYARIDISTLIPGVYSLTVMDTNHRNYNFKFVKK